MRVGLHVCPSRCVRVMIASHVIEHPRKNANICSPRESIALHGYSHPIITVIMESSCDGKAPSQSFTADDLRRDSSPRLRRQSFHGRVGATTRIFPPPEHHAAKGCMQRSPIDYSEFFTTRESKILHGSST